MSPITVRPRHLIAGAAVAALVGYAAYRLPTSAASSSLASSARAAAVAVDCEPSQRAVVQQIPAAAEPQITVRCVSADTVQPVAYVDEAGRYPAPTAPVSDARVVRTVYTAPEPVVAPRVVTAASPARVATAAPAPAPTTTVARQREARSWKKRAVVIGGSAGAGAGLGALIGGKKGAAIGAAIGGGAGTIYEVVKHH